MKNALKERLHRKIMKGLFYFEVVRILGPHYVYSKKLENKNSSENDSKFILNVRQMEFNFFDNRYICSILHVLKKKI